MSHGVGMHAPIVTGVGAWASGAMASPVMRSSVPVFMGLRAATRLVALRLGGEVEYAVCVV